MPRVSRESAPNVQDAGPVLDRSEELDSYTASFTLFRQDLDGTQLLKGLPDDRCQCPHWGYVVSGSMTFRFADHEEVFSAGDAFYTAPGHVPVHNDADTEIVLFSPTEELRKTEAVMAQNMQSLQVG